MTAVDRPAGTSGGGAAGRGGTAGSSTAGSGGGAAGRGGTTGAAGTGGGASTLPFSFYIGADITDQEPQPAATRANLLTILKAHGFNYVRLRTFVDPRAADGYDKQNGWGGIDPTVAFGKQVKDAGMGLLIDFHYADNWADPAKQCVPPAWQGYTTIAQLATAVHDYTRDAINKLIAGGARPDMVQIGNEITPGILIHRCDSGGIPNTGMGINPVNGALYYYSERDPTARGRAAPRRLDQPRPAAEGGRPRPSRRSTRGISDRAAPRSRQRPLASSRSFVQAR